MSTAIDKLRRILVLEREQSCHDRAVIGGLERFLSFWQKEAREQAGLVTGEITVDQILAKLAGYATMPVDQRRQVVEELVVTLARVRLISEQESAPSTPDSGESHAPHLEAASPARHEPATPVTTVAPKEKEPVLSPEAPSTQVPMTRETGPNLAEPPSTAAPTRQTEAGPASPRRVRPIAPPIALSDPVTALKGIGTGERRLAPLGIATVRDLLYHLPRRYDDYARLAHINQLELGQVVNIAGLVVRTSRGQTRNGLAIFSVILRDGTGQIGATWYNQPYLSQQIHEGTELIISGRVDQYLCRLVFKSPEWELAREELLNTGRLVPVYPLTEGVSQRWLRRIIKRTVDDIAPRLVDPVPANVRHDADLMPLAMAIAQVHFPDDPDMLRRARQRLAFD